MKRLTNKYLLFSIIAALTFACSPYQKALKSEDTMLKVRMIDTLMKKEKYGKAIALFDQVKNKYRGTDSAPDMALKYAEALYKDRTYILSANQYERFTTSHPRHPKRDMALFMAAKSHYQMSEVYSKDQRDTKIALAKLQDYINVYPDGEYVKEANVLVDELRTKLDKKAFEIARNYHHRERYIAAIESFENFILDHPGSTYQDDAHFYILDSQFEYGINSVATLVPERLELAKNYYNTFARRFPNSEYMEDANEILEKIEAYKPETEL
ncbi:outer membrane protein assembly factor BamD [Nonlabens spongiae]|uniref:Outer membrane protein assembly factor BamD n=1 Tax=Nonlabens spongiae TaxID=331648 RepID=A0A1W6MJP9_9FLAO|nr:outer membrane protein assembly factor BamD [Nonlabens spongiae]ARN77831.1 outer membrane protein assembly factor BamD [Nonlabens spongiae]